MRSTFRPILFAATVATVASAGTVAGTLATTLTASPQAGDDADAPPPGLVEIPGGRTHIGMTEKEITALVTATPSALGLIRALDAETGGDRQAIPTFYMCVNELTNEQYKPFVEATGHRPPFEWGRTAIEAAQAKFLEEQGKLRAAAAAEGKRPPERQKFDQEKWWSRNWKEAAWEMPETDALKPVTYVAYADALAYCRWAGLRLPTELEFQRAARGDSRNPFPWGEQWDDKKYANTNEFKGRAGTMPVGSFPEGVSPYGIYDLSGNVWEWTNSPYLAYPKFKKHKYTFGKGGARETKEPEPRWDANQRVAVSGSWQNGMVAARVTTRRPCDRTQITDGMGFRPAASSAAIGADIAQSVYTSDVQNSDARGQGVTYAPNKVVAIDMWDMADSAHQGAVPGYKVITNYEYIAFVPVDQLGDSQDVTFRKSTLVEPKHLGFLSTTSSFVEPKLDPGTYLVAFRAAGERVIEAEAEPDPKEGEPAKEEPETKEEPVDDPWAALIDIKQPNLLFIDAISGEFVAAIQPGTISFSKGSGGGQITNFEEKIWKKDAEGNDVQEIKKWMKLEVGIHTKIRKRVWPLEFKLMPEPGTTSKNWRR